MKPNETSWLKKHERTVSKLKHMGHNHTPPPTVNDVTSYPWVVVYGICFSIRHATAIKWFLHYCKLNKVTQKLDWVSTVRLADAFEVKANMLTVTMKHTAAEAYGRFCCYVSMYWTNKSSRWKEMITKVMHHCTKCNTNQPTEWETNTATRTLNLLVG